MGHRAFAVAAGAAAVLAFPGVAGAAPGKGHKRVCAEPAPGSAACHAEVLVDAQGKPLVTAAPSGYGPADLRAAYKITASGSAANTIAIVDAYDDPTAASDLATYRSTYGLPPCTAASGCFSKVDQNGGTTVPRKNGGWAQEISLDLDMASAICPSCHLLLVEASSASILNLATAVSYAGRRAGVVAISNSYGGSEFSTETSYDSYYNQPGKAVTVSSGDSGYGVQFPAASRFVTAVGGTGLRRATSTTRGWSETAWSGAGSGCSAYEAKPSWQTDAGCARRTVADVSADADPNTGVAVYDSTAYQGAAGWMVFGGTSVAAPIVAGAYALAANGGAPSLPYSHPSALFDVTSGSNGSCGGSYLCTARAGFDGPTGLGTPNGTGAF